MQRDVGSKSSKWRKDDNETTSLVGRALAKLQTQSYLPEMDGAKPVDEHVPVTVVHSIS